MAQAHDSVGVASEGDDGLRRQPGGFIHIGEAREADAVLPLVLAVLRRVKLQQHLATCIYNLRECQARRRPLAPFVDKLAPMAPTRPNLLVLVRHGQSERNVARRGNTFFPDDESRQGLRGEPDQRTPLTDLGRRQARDAGQRGRQNDQHLPERVAHRSPRVDGVI